MLNRFTFLEVSKY